jgi:hypothetical protein
MRANPVLYINGFGFNGSDVNNGDGDRRLFDDLCQHLGNKVMLLVHATHR